MWLGTIHLIVIAPFLQAADSPSHLMFEDYEGTFTASQDISLATHEDNPVDNEIALPPDDGSRRQALALEEQFEDVWTRRKPPCGAYNCAGHVWASRRTAIYRWSEIEKILTDDGYTKISVQECKPGDLAFYHTGETWIHVGRIVGRLDSTDKGIRSSTMVLSKWDDKSGEYIHQENDVPFREDFPQYDIAYYTDR